MIRILRAADCVAVPWKNGGGVTREVAVWPPHAALYDFAWRVSIAEVREAGPFSRFDDIDRILMVLEGRLALTFAERAIELTPDSEPFSFPGDDACVGSPMDGTVTDLNVMTRRRQTRARVHRAIRETMTLSATHTLVVAIAPCGVDVFNDRIALDARDAIHIERATGDIGIAGAAYAMEFA